MNNVNNNKWYDPDDQEAADLDSQIIEENTHWENEEYREGKPLKSFPVHPKHQRILNKIGESNE